MLKATDRKEIELWIEEQIAKILPEEVKIMRQVPAKVRKGRGA